MKGKYYVHNKDMLEELKLLHGDGGYISEKLHLMFFDMAKGIGTKGRFSGYTWIDDMISDAYLKCCNVAHKFDIERTNPYGYFTTVIHHYFYDAINAERNQKNIKEKLREDQISQLYHRYGIQFKVNASTKATK